MAVDRLPNPDTLRAESDLAARVARLELEVAELGRRPGVSATEAEQRARVLFKVMTQPALAALTQRDAQRDRTFAEAIGRIERLEAALKLHRAEMERAARSLAGNVRGVRAETLVGVGLAVLTLVLGAAAILLR